MSELDIQPSLKPTTDVSMIAGGIAGLTVDLALYPLDTIKTRLQSSEGFLKSGGLRGVYRGMQSVALGSAPGSAAFFVAYEQTAPKFAQLAGQDNTRQIAGTNYKIYASSPIGHMLAAMFGEFAACLIRVPTDHLKMRMQINKFTTLREALQDSPHRLYSGFATTLTREIPFSVIQFPLYEFLKRRLHDVRFRHAHHTLNKSYEESLNYAQVPVLYTSIIGAMVGFVAAALTTPLDVSRTRIMLGRDPYGESYTTNPFTTMKRIFIEGCRAEKAHAVSSVDVNMPSPQTIQPHAHIDPKSHPLLNPGDVGKYYRGGVKSLFRGVVPRTMWISIGGCVYFGAFEAAKSFLQRKVPSPSSTSSQQKPQHYQ